MKKIPGFAVFDFQDLYDLFSTFFRVVSVMARSIHAIEIRLNKNLTNNLPNYIEVCQARLWNLTKTREFRHFPVSFLTNVCLFSLL